MKTSRWIPALLLGLAVALCATGCKDDDKKSDPLVGTWKAQTFNGQPIGNDVSLKISFRDNGTYTATTVVYGNTEVETGTWSAANGILTTIDSDGQKEDRKSVV